MVSSGSQRIVHLRNLIDHPRTGPGERAAAQRMLDKILEKSSTPTASTAHRPVRGGRHAGLSRIADMVCEDIVLARSRVPAGRSGVAVKDPIADVPAQVRIVVETPYDAGISISVDNVPPDWGWIYEDGIQTVSPAFRALVDALADIMSAYNHEGDGIEKRFFGRIQSGAETLAW